MTNELKELMDEFSAIQKQLTENVHRLGDEGLDVDANIAEWDELMKRHDEILPVMVKMQVSDLD